MRAEWDTLAPKASTFEGRTEWLQLVGRAPPEQFGIPARGYEPLRTMGPWGDAASCRTRCPAARTAGR